jgi:Na+-driven multidrug efflux pump
MDARTRLLLEGPVSSTILRLSLPNVIVMVVQTSIGLIETYFVAKLGLDALAGMALVFPLYMLLQMVAAGAMGGAILSAVARALGSGHRDRANELVWYAVAVTIVLGALTTDGWPGRIAHRSHDLFCGGVCGHDSVVAV